MRFLLLLAALPALAQVAPRIAPPIIKQRVQPDYTAAARAANLEGTVTVYFEIDEHGATDQVQVIQSLGLGLDENAVEAVKQWRFAAGTVDDTPARMAQGVEIRFHLQDPASWRVRHTAYHVLREDSNKSEAVVRPVFSHYTRPDPAACAANPGSAEVQLRVGKDGVPSNISVLDATDEAVRTAVNNAVSTWRFQPALGGNRPRVADAFFFVECSQLNPAEPFPPPAVRVGGGNTAPAMIHKVEPEYSEPARKTKYQGNVIVYTEIDTAGIPVNLKIARLLGLGLDVKAMEALKQWRFRPGMRGGHPVQIIANIEISFRLL